MAAVQDTADSPHPLHDPAIHRDPDGIYNPPPESKPERTIEADAHALATRLLSHWHDVTSEQSIWRVEMQRDEQYYDGIQWTEDERAVMEERHQQPLVFNHIKPSVDWLLGTERKTRIDYKIMPRSRDDVQGAEIKEKLVKYVHDQTRASWARSLAFRDAVKVGLGWLEDGVRGDIEDDPLFSRHESWRNVWHDHLASEPDLSDGRYIFRMKYVDVDTGQAMYPEFRNEVWRASRSYDQVLDNHDGVVGWESTAAGLRRGTSPSAVESAKRRRVRMLECWYRVPVAGKRFRSFMGSGLNGDYDPENPEMARLLSEGLASLHDAIVMRVRVAMLLPDTGFLLSDMDSPYKHNKFPFTPVWGFRRADDGAPYGVIRQCIDPQFDLNKRASKALFVLSTNQVVMEEGAVEDPDELADNVAAPDGIIVKKRGHELEIRSDKNLAQAHLDLLDRDKVYIKDISGITDENLGRETNATSGRAILAKQTEGATVTFSLFDNLRFAAQIQGEKQLSLIEQYYDLPKQVRLVGDDGQYDWLEINMAQYAPDGSLQVINDVGRTKADFVVDVQDFHASTRQAMSETLFQTAAKLPGEMAIPLLIRGIDLLDLPRKEEIMDDVRAALGQQSAESMTPEQQQAAQQEQQIKVRQAIADVMGKESKARLDDAKAVETNVKTQREALVTAEELGQTPMSVPPMGDQVLREAGYGGRHTR